MVEEQDLGIGEVEEPQNEPQLVKPKGDDAFGQLASIVPERLIDLPDEVKDEDIGHGTLKERMEAHPNLSDMQTADKRMFPDLGVRHLNTIQVSRVFPDIYNPFGRILVKDLLKNSNNGDMSVAEALADVNTSMSIAIDGEGRIDELGLIGKTTEMETEDKKLKGMGLG